MIFLGLQNHIEFLGKFKKIRIPEFKKKIFLIHAKVILTTLYEKTTYSPTKRSCFLHFQATIFNIQNKLNYHKHCLNRQQFFLRLTMTKNQIGLALVLWIEVGQRDVCRRMF